MHTCARRADKLLGVWSKMQSQGTSRKKSVGCLGNIPRPTSRLQCMAAFATSPSDTSAFSVCAALIVRGGAPCYQRTQPWKYTKRNACY